MRYIPITKIIIVTITKDIELIKKKISDFKIGSIFSYYNPVTIFSQIILRIVNLR